MAWNISQRNLWEENYLGKEETLKYFYYVFISIYFYVLLVFIYYVLLVFIFKYFYYVTSLIDL